MGPCGSQARRWINEGKEGYVIGKGGSPEKMDSKEGYVIGKGGSPEKWILH
jgi:hypothetical protein